MMGKNFSQQATLTKDFYSCLSLLHSIFPFIQEEGSPGETEGTLRMTLSSCSLSEEKKAEQKEEKQKHI